MLVEQSYEIEEILHDAEGLSAALTSLERMEQMNAQLEQQPMQQQQPAAARKKNGQTPKVETPDRETGASRQGRAPCDGQGRAKPQELPKKEPSVGRRLMNPLMKRKEPRTAPPQEETPQARFDEATSSGPECVLEMLKMVEGSPAWRKELAKTAQWLANLNGGQAVIDSRSSPWKWSKKTALWMTRAWAVYSAVQLWVAVQMWAGPISKHIRIPILGPLRHLLPKRYGNILKEISLPLYQTIAVVVRPRNKMGVILAKIHEKYGGWRSLYTLSWLKNLRSVRRANDHRLWPAVSRLMLAAATHMWVQTWEEPLDIQITERSAPVFEALSLALKKRSMFTSRTPETLAMLRETGISWLKHEDNEELVGKLEPEEVHRVLQAAVVNAMLPDSYEKASVGSILKGSRAMRRLKNINTRGWDRIVDLVWGLRLPKR